MKTSKLKSFDSKHKGFSLGSLTQQNTVEEGKVLFY